MKKIFTFYLNHFRSTQLLHTKNTDFTENIDSGVVYKAPENSVNTIMAFARAHYIMETKSQGTIEMIQN